MQITYVGVYWHILQSTSSDLHHASNAFYLLVLSIEKCPQMPIEFVPTTLLKVSICKSLSF